MATRWSVLGGFGARCPLGVLGLVLGAHEVQGLTARFFSISGGFRAAKSFEIFGYFENIPFSGTLFNFRYFRVCQVF